MNAIKINKLRIHLLGKLTFRLNEEPIRWFPTDRVRALLLILAMSPTLTEQRSTLANLLWSEVNDKSARRNLRRCLLRLRKVVGDDVVVATRQTIGLVSAESDYNTFQALTQSNNHNDWQTAVDLIQSEMVEGFVLKNAPLFDDWITAQRLAATQQQRDLLIKLLALETEDGLARLRYAQKWVAIAPYDDAAHRAIMSAHATQGNTAAAIIHYDQFSAQLAVELAVEPDPNTRALYENLMATTIYQPLQLHNFPTQLTVFVGRIKERDAIVNRLQNLTCRMVTLLGAGGIGKTHLAIEVAQALTSDLFVDGVYFVPLVTAATSYDVLTELHRVFDLPSQRDDLMEQLLAYLHDKRLLLLLDNVEQLAGELGFLARLLQVAGGVKILATSRDVVGISAEYRYPLTGITDLDEASTILWEAIKRIAPSFTPTPDDHMIAHEICELVHGVPLALELAATWSSTLDLANIRDEIAHTYDFLESPLLDTPDRHRSLRAIFEYSWALLNEHTRAILAAASIFEGGFDLNAARDILGAQMRDLRRLVEQSLLIKVHGSAGQPRYSLHQLVREFLVEKLTNPTPKYHTHAQYYLTLVAGLEQQLVSLVALSASEKISVDLANIQAAWRWAVANGETAQLTSAVLSLTRFFRLTGRYSQGNKLFAETTNHLTDPLLLAKLHTGIATCHMWQSHYDASIHAAQKAFALALEVGDEVIIAESLTSWGRALRAKGDFQAAISKLREAVAASQGDACAAIRGEALSHLAVLALYGGRTQVGVQLADAAMMAVRQSDNKMIESHVLGIVSFARSQTGYLTQAVTLSNEALALSQQMGNRLVEGQNIIMRGRANFFVGRFVAAIEDVTVARNLYQQIGDTLGEIFALTTLTRSYAELGEYKQALVCSERWTTLAIERGAMFHYANALAYRANILCDMGKFHEAQPILVELTRITEAHGLPVTFYYYSAFGLAEVALALDMAKIALNHITDLVDDLLQDEAYNFALARICLIGYRVLLANNDPRAIAILKQGYDRIQRYAIRITASAQRQTYLDKVPNNRALIAIYQAQAPFTEHH